MIFEESSFRDPSGYVFYKNGKIYRKINPVYKKEFDQILQSKLFERLQKEKLLIQFKKTSPDLLEVETVPFISYPYEWSFSQLQDAARLTLKIQKIALEHNMSLKDSSAYNIQFFDGQPILIDILSFEKYQEDTPWVAYRQFCQHFLAPLALMSLTDIRLNQLLKLYIDGIPLDLVSKILPKKTWINFPLLSHIHIHAGSQKYFAGKTDAKKRKVKLSKHNLLALVNSLASTVNKLNLPKQKTEWGDYYTFTNYSDRAFLNKKKLVESFIKKLRPKTVWDLGANTGEFSRVAAQSGSSVVSFDVDPIAVEKNYRQVRNEKEKKILPLISDLTNPSPALGWENAERRSLSGRGPADCVMALALIHHLAISNNVPLGRIAKFFAQIGKAAIVEWVPKSDSQVQKLLATREDIFVDYDQGKFEKEFSQYFKILDKKQIQKYQRTLYCMQSLKSK